MRVYIAAPWKWKELAEHAAWRLRKAGFTVTRDWWNFEAGDEDHETLGELAFDDMLAVMAADEVVVLNYESSEGKAVETGIALMAQIPVAVIGKPSNIFHHMSTRGVTLYDSLNQWLASKAEAA